MPLKISILSIGRIDAEVLSKLRDGLTTVFNNADVTFAGALISLPKRAFSPRRRQYHSTKILNDISKTAAEMATDKVLGVTSVDLYVPGLNYVFGEAQYPGKAALISLFRLKPEFYGHSPDEGLLLQRALKEAVHELGHTSGLTHCDNSRCVMSFSNTITLVDFKNTKFCEVCEKQLMHVGFE